MQHFVRHHTMLGQGNMLSGSVIKQKYGRHDQEEILGRTTVGQELILKLSDGTRASAIHTNPYLNIYKAELSTEMKNLSIMKH